MKGNQFDICSNFHKGNNHSIGADYDTKKTT